MIFILVSEVFLTKEQALKIVFKDSKIDTLKLFLDNEIKKKIKGAKLPLPTKDSVSIYKNDSLIAIIDDIKGKYLPITYMVVLRKNKTIKFVEILAYREAYGGQIKSKEFLKQFENKNIDKQITIKNIPGATISVNSIKFGVERELLIYEHFYDKIWK